MIEQVFPHRIEIYRVPKSGTKNELIVDTICNAQSVNTGQDLSRSEYRIIMPVVDEAELLKPRLKLSVNLTISGVTFYEADVIWLKNNYITEIDGVPVGCSMVVRFVTQPFV